MLETEDTEQVPPVVVDEVPAAIEPVRTMPSRRWLGGIVAAALLAGFLGGMVAGSMQEGPRGPAGKLGPQGAQGPAGAAADVEAKLADAAKQTDSKIEDLGMCWEANYAYGNVTYVSGVSLFSASRKPNGTIYCSSGTYIPVKASAEGAAGE